MREKQKLTKAQLKLLERAERYNGIHLRGSSEHQCAERIVHLLWWPYQYTTDFVILNDAGRAALRERAVLKPTEKP